MGFIGQYATFLDLGFEGRHGLLVECGDRLPGGSARASHESSGRFVRSQPGKGTTFVVELPRNLEKLHAPALDGSVTVTQHR